MNCPVCCEGGVQKYLKKRAVTAPWKIIGTTKNKFSAVVVIPALAEVDNLPATLASLSLNPSANLQQTLVLIVVNNRSDASIKEKENNRQTLKWLGSNPFSRLNLAWIDASSDGLELPDKEGVGFARKIGMDLALPLLDWDSLALLISLDADTLVDKKYLPAIFHHFGQTSVGGAVLPYRHQPAETIPQEVAIRSYELYLRSYLLGLQLAGSPYAYHTIGSAFACRASAYVAAAGMNRRHAGEDFYFLQQLSKVTGIEMVAGTVVRPSARFSNRVPFGTGKVVQGQIETGQPLYSFVSAPSFQVLKSWFELVADNLDMTACDLSFRAQQFSPILFDFLNELNFNRVWGRLCQNHTTDKKLLTAFHHWFDALRTRQLLTRLEFNSASSSTIVAELLSWGGYVEVEQAEVQLALLERLQGVVGGVEGSCIQPQL